MSDDAMVPKILAVTDKDWTHGRAQGNVEVFTCISCWGQFFEFLLAPPVLANKNLKNKNGFRHQAICHGSLEAHNPENLFWGLEELHVDKANHVF